MKHDPFRRLKFAQARGAQIERFAAGQWIWMRCPSWVPDGNYRIRPSDAHLEYGPISSGIRAMALDERNSQGYCHEGWQHHCFQFAERWLQGDRDGGLGRHLFPEDIGEAYFAIPIDEWRMLLLLYAEPMADEGL